MVQVIRSVPMTPFLVMAVGPNPPNLCRIFAGVVGTMVNAVISASFPGPTGSANRCVFSRPGPVPGCQLRTDNGLPVELLDFDIEESGDSQSEGSHEPEGSTTEDGTLSEP